MVGASPTTVAMDTCRGPWMWTAFQSLMGQKLVMGCTEVKGKRGNDCVNKTFAIFDWDQNAEP